MTLSAKKLALIVVGVTPGVAGQDAVLAAFVGVGVGAAKALLATTANSIEALAPTATTAVLRRAVLETCILTSTVFVVARCDGDCFVANQSKEMSV